jgi:hypothetical protein
MADADAKYEPRTTTKKQISVQVKMQGWLGACGG